MSTDKELLELAAKAAGISGEFDGLTGSFVPNDGFIPSSHQFYWNPLKIDGDAFRLMVQLNLLIMPYPIDGAVRITRLDQPDTIEHFGDDPYAATRRAVVRAAAEIGKLLGKSDGTR